MKKEREHREVFEGAQAIYDGAMDKIQQKDAEYVTLFNSLSWNRLVRVELPKGYSLFGSAETQQFADKTVVFA